MSTISGEIPLLAGVGSVIGPEYPRLLLLFRTAVVLYVVMPALYAGGVAHLRAPVSPRDFTAGSAAGKARALPADRMSPPVFGRFPLLGKLKPGVFARGMPPGEPRKRAAPGAFLCGRGASPARN